MSVDDVTTVVNYVCTWSKDTITIKLEYSLLEQACSMLTLRGNVYPLRWLARPKASLSDIRRVF